MILKTMFRHEAAKWSILALVISSALGCAKEGESTGEKLSRANQHFSEGQYFQSAKEAREVLVVDPSNDAAQSLLATIYFEQGQLLQAYPLLKAVAERHQD